MNDQPSRKRLDEILLQQGKLSEDQISIALNHQKTFGGKFGTHILHHGFVDEAALVGALAEHFNCRGIQLSNLEIPKSVIGMIPADLAYSRNIIPFDYDQQRDKLCVACEDPTDEALLAEIKYVVSAVRVELFVGVEISINLAISRHYGERQPVAELQSADQTESSIPFAVRYEESKRDNANTIMLVVHDNNSAEVIRILLEKSGHPVLKVDSADRAIDYLSTHDFHSVFIQEGVAGNCLDLINRLRVSAPHTRVRPFQTLAGLVLNEDADRREQDQIQGNLELFTSLLTMKDRMPSSHSTNFGHYVERLSRALKLDERRRMMVVNAAYLHERARTYYLTGSPRDFRSLVGLATRLLQSVYYEPQVVDILRFMYVDVSKLGDREQTQDLLAGNILTVVNMLSDLSPANQRLTLDRIDQVMGKIKAKVGTEILPEVYEAFDHLVRQEVSRAPMFTRHEQIMVYSDRQETSFMIVGRLKSEGFRTISAGSVASCRRLCERSRPDIIILALNSDPREIISTVNSLSESGVNFSNVPTFLLVDRATAPQLTSLVERGLEDIIDRDTDLDMLVLKVRKAVARLDVVARPQGEEVGEVGSRGSLHDMNLIDLLQALGPSRKTTKITVNSAARPGDVLEIFLDQGNIVFAQLNNLNGAEAIYIGLTWDDGIWTVEPIDRSELRRNNELSNESILMEGCRLIDEMTTKLGAF